MVDIENTLLLDQLTSFYSGQAKDFPVINVNVDYSVPEVLRISDKSGRYLEILSNYDDFMEKVNHAETRQGKKGISCEVCLKDWNLEFRKFPNVNNSAGEKRVLDMKLLEFEILDIHQKKMIPDDENWDSYLNHPDIKTAMRLKQTKLDGESLKQAKLGSNKRGQLTTERSEAKTFHTHTSSKGEVTPFRNITNTSNHDSDILLPLDELLHSEQTYKNQDTIGKNFFFIKKNKIGPRQKSLFVTAMASTQPKANLQKTRTGQSTRTYVQT